MRADELGFDYAWVAEHHFSNEYGIMPDVFVYAGYLAALTKRIKIGTAVVTLPLANPLRVAENAAFVDILSGGRFVLGLGSGYRKYEFDGFGVDFERRRDIQEEALPLLMELLHKKRIDHQGKYFHGKVDGAYELFPHRGAAAASADLPRRLDRTLARRRRRAGLRHSCCRAGRRSPSWRGRPRIYRAALEETPAELRGKTARAAMSTWRAGSMWRRPTPRPSAKAKTAS